MAVAINTCQQATIGGRSRVVFDVHEAGEEAEEGAEEEPEEEPEELQVTGQYGEKRAFCYKGRWSMSLKLSRPQILLVSK